MKAPIESSRLLTLVELVGGRRVVIAGDLIADEFIYGEIARVSREAPVLILNYDSTEVVPGGAGNAASNVAALGGAACLAGGVGRDEMTAADHSWAGSTSTPRRVAAGGVSHADEDAHSGRRHPLRQAAGRPHRPRVVRDGRRSHARRVRIARAAQPARLGRAAHFGLRQRPRVARARRARAEGAAREGTAGRRLALQPRCIPRHDACTPNDRKSSRRRSGSGDDPRMLERAGRADSAATRWPSPSRAAAAALCS